MFTIKFYSEDGFRTRILSAESFTVLRGDNGEAEITLHQKHPTDDMRYDIVPATIGRPDYAPPLFGKAIIENMAGKTTEIIALRPSREAPPPAAA